MERSSGWTVLLPAPKGRPQSLLEGKYRNGGQRLYKPVQAALKAAHGLGMAICRCVERPPDNRMPALPIRELPNGECILVLNKNSGPFHNSNCFWFREDLRNSGAQSYVDGVIIEDGDTFKLRLKTSLKPREKKKADGVLEAPAPRDRAPGKTQRAMTQRGLLNFLWDFSGLNVWRPEFIQHREPAAAFGRLRAMTKNIIVARHDLRSQLALCFKPSPNWNEPFRKWAVRDSRGLVLAILDGINPDLTIAARHLQENALVLQATQPVVDHLTASFARELAIVKNPDAAVIALLTCDFGWAGPNVRGTVVDAALLATHAASLIPVESSYELAFASYLIENGRRFRKPMRYDADEDVVFPDFLLEDTFRPDLPAEIWGRTDAEYRARMAKKAMHFNTVAPGWISWDATTGEPLPKLPPARTQKAS